MGNNSRNKSYRRSKNKKMVLETGNNSDKANLLDSSILIAFLSALGYYVAYSYKRGYLEYYGLSDIFITQISITTVVLSISLFGSIFFIISALLYMISPSENEKDNFIRTTVKKAILPILLIILISPFFKDHIFFLQILSFLLVVWLIFVPLFTNRERLHSFSFKSFLEILSLIMLKGDNLIKKISILISLSIFISILANMVGGYHAGVETEYMLIEQKGAKYLVIDSMGENFIIAPFNSKNNSIKQEFLIVEIKSDIDKPIIFKKVSVNGGINP
ncbi:hypothetical protein AB9M93_26155 [Peribacillus frigoritolerans]|uniref:hypothetical protein n=1 Tax=Peribacillus frigoritolerans TaxID=450367 RepID=UPI00351159D4